MRRISKGIAVPFWIGAAAVLFATLPVAAQDAGIRIGNVTVYQDVHHDVSAPLSQIAIPATPHTGAPRIIQLLRGSAGPAAPTVQDPVGDNVAGKTPVTTQDLLNFDGQGADGVAPPDTNGAVGATQYVQWVNIEYNVYDKTTGTKILGPIQGNSFWSGFGGTCQSHNDGDPIIQYDKAAGRWVAFQNVFSAPYMACIAVSTTSDATGSYFRYAFNLGSVNFPDYPKWGVWPDAYYASWENFKNAISDIGSEACAADRTNMLLGNPATLQCFANNGYSQMLPSDLDGLTPPPAGAPNHYIHIATTTGNLDQFDFHVDFTNPANSTFTGPTLITAAPFNEICNNATNRNCIKEPSPGEGLDSLGDRLMYRNAYRNFGTYESLLDTHTVKPSITGATSIGAVRWYELRAMPPGGAFRAFQQGSIQNPSISFWMASIAQDKLGDIAIGMSYTSTTIDPGVVYTGRVPTDPRGRMEGLKQVVKGTGVQQATSNRWGDYSAMSIDPTDDCTFFYTQEYIKTTGSFKWSTRINSFKFRSCQ
jgi:hypothetical protein